jgi:hypothetical protein
MKLARLVPLLLLLVLPAEAAVASPVKCTGSELTPDGRVFPEPRKSTQFLRFDEFRCGVALLEKQHPELIEVKTVGTSPGGHPVIDVLLTDERVRPRRGREKEKLLVVSSIHGDEVGGREGGVRVIEDMVDPALLGDEPWVQKVLDDYTIHFVFPNPDGWVNGDVLGSDGAGTTASRGNEHGTDLNRQFPVKGWISTANKTLAEPEGRNLLDTIFRQDGWYLGTDNHGQLHDSYAAAGLQIVGQFDFQKSETLARFADGITESMKEYDVLGSLEDLKAATGADLGAYHWGTLYDMLGYSASGSMIDYYNTADGLDGTGFATELTVGREVNWLTYPPQLNQVWVDSIRAINYTMFKQAIDRKRFTFPVGSRAAYVHDQKVIRHDDANGSGYQRKAGEDIPQKPYRVSRMKFFEDLNGDASRRLDPLRVSGRMGPFGGAQLRRYESLVLTGDGIPAGRAGERFYAQLRRWVEDGGNLVVTDSGVQALAKMGLLDESAITMDKHYVGFVDFTDRDDPLTEGLRGVASQTYDTVPIGYQFGSSSQNSAPNWKVSTEAWEAEGGRTLGRNGSGKTIYGELPVGDGRVRFLGALLPDPTEAYYHPYGLQNYAVTYTGYTLLENMLKRP